ncbi:MAG TPA: cyclic nucleotide-binding domain-containing protein [Candidatus Dormibacteraeota bacterium]
MDLQSTVPGLFRNAQSTTEVPEGGVIFSEGDTGSEMYGVVEGQVELRGSAGVLATLGPGDVFGEMALIAKDPRSATAVATAPTVLAVIDRHRFLFMVQETPTFALQIMAVMASRIRTSNLAG